MRVEFEFEFASERAAEQTNTVAATHSLVMLGRSIRVESESESDSECELADEQLRRN